MCLFLHMFVCGGGGIYLYMCVHTHINVCHQDGYLKKFLDFCSLQHPVPPTQGWKLARGKLKTELLFGEEPWCSHSGWGGRTGSSPHQLILTKHTFSLLRHGLAYFNSYLLFSSLKETFIPILAVLPHFPSPGCYTGSILAATQGW